jgi:hypothetical protein
MQVLYLFAALAIGALLCLLLLGIIAFRWRAQWTQALDYFGLFEPDYELDQMYEEERVELPPVGDEPHHPDPDIVESGWMDDAPPLTPPAQRSA